MTTFTKFSACDTKAAHQDTSEVTVSGTPEHTVWVHFKGAGDAVRAGVWESTAGVFRGPMNNQVEYCHILEGAASIRTEDRNEFHVKAGDGFVMDNGLQPIWTVEDRVKKQWVVVSVPSGDYCA